jgi:hypothetical protein
MAGDRVREAFKTKLAAVVLAAGCPWTVKETENVFASADGQTSFVALEFDGSPPQQQRTWGQPGNNRYREEGNVWVRVVAPINSGNDVAGWARAIADRFLDQRFDTADGRTIRTLSGAPSPTRVGGRWIESVPVAYRVHNLA